jgi:hypothetical protein
VSEKKIHKIGRIDQIVRDYFDAHPSQNEVAAKDLMVLFIKKGIFKKANKEVKPIGDFVPLGSPPHSRVSCLHTMPFNEETASTQATILQKHNPRTMKGTACPLFVPLGSPAHSNVLSKDPGMQRRVSCQHTVPFHEHPVSTEKQYSLLKRNYIPLALISLFILQNHYAKTNPYCLHNFIYFLQRQTSGY